jgi:hypothetical protein
MSCYTDCCPETAQLCVDASFFVPQNVDGCYVTYLNFYAGNPSDRLRFDTLKPIYIYQYETGVTNYSADLLWLDQSVSKKVVGTFKFDVKVDELKQTIVVQNASIEGKNVALGESDLLSTQAGITTNDCYINYLKYAGNLTLGDPVPPTSSAVNTTYEVKLAGIKIGTISLKTVWSWLGGNASTQSIGIPAELSLSVESGNFFTSGKTSDNSTLVSENLLSVILKNGQTTQVVTQPMNIGDACLCLQLRANKNVLNAAAENADPESFPPGTYDVCISYKPCEGVFENLSVFRIEITSDQTIKATWGKDTNKNNQVIKTPYDSVKLNKVNVTVCGDIVGVFNNTNDFALCIENVMQCFSLVGLNGLVKSKVGNSDVKPLSSGVLIFNPDKLEHIKAELANSKLYFSIRYVSVIPEKEETLPKPLNCCAGTLNPFSNSNAVAPGYIKIKGFCTCEITHMQDHPLNGSRLSREVTCCLSKEFIESFQ